MRAVYPIAIHKDPTSSYGVTVPDLPGCFSAGETVEEAISMAREAIEGHAEVLADDGEAVAPPSPIERYRSDPDFADAFWAVVEVELERALEPVA